MGQERVNEIVGSNERRRRRRKRKLLKPFCVRKREKETGKTNTDKELRDVPMSGSGQLIEY